MKYLFTQHDGQTQFQKYLEWESQIRCYQRIYNNIAPIKAGFVELSTQILENLPKEIPIKLQVDLLYIAFWS